MKDIENIKKRFVLGISGTLVACYLLDTKEQIKSANEELTDAELEIVFKLLQKEIERITQEQEEQPCYNG